METGTSGDLSVTDLLDLALAFRARGSSKTVMVGRTRRRANRACWSPGNRSERV
jgi:hypothetical protein